MPLKFAPTTRVRNTYEYVDPETGEQMVERNDYNANATGNVNMPGYSMHSRRFRPHSKSSIQRAETVMRGLRHEQQMERENLHNLGFNMSGVNGVEYNTGLRPAMSANSYPGYVHFNVDRNRKVRNMHNAQTIYGNAWVDALATIETIEEEEETAMSQLLAEFDERKRSMETEFTQRTGLKSPSELARIFREEVAQLDEADLATYLTEYSSAKDRYLDAYNSINAADARPYNNAYDALRAEINERKEAFDLIKHTRMGQIRVGRPIGAVNRRTFKNRLSAAQNRARAAAAASTSCIGCLPNY
jgi:hypothetical protein